MLPTQCWPEVSLDSRAWSTKLTQTRTTFVPRLAHRITLLLFNMSTVVNSGNITLASDVSHIVSIEDSVPDEGASLFDSSTEASDETTIGVQEYRKVVVDKHMTEVDKTKNELHLLTKCLMTYEVRRFIFASQFVGRVE